MIEFRNVDKSFGPRSVLRDLSFRVPKGQIYFILGRSGTGKSVTLKSLVGLIRPDGGEILVDGESLRDRTESDFGRIRRKCGLVFQLPALLDSRSLFDNLILGIRALPLKEQIARARQSLTEVGLEKLWSTIAVTVPPALSYGEQKRIALARTLVLDPEYILFDEPTTGLDPLNSRRIHDLIRNVVSHRAKTAIVVSHDVRNALRTADRVAIMAAGQIVDQGTPNEIAVSRRAETRAFLNPGARN